MTWDPEAEAILERIVSGAPELGEPAIQEAVRAEAERIATRDGNLAVMPDDVVKASILATPGHLRAGLRHGMRSAGVDVDRWAPYFTV